MKTLLTFCTTLCLVFLGLTINANTQYYTISGDCLESSSNQGISGVEIVISTSSSSQVTYTDVTDLLGHYSIQVPANRIYKVTATLDGQSQSQSTVSSLTSNREMDPFYFE